MSFDGVPVEIIHNVLEYVTASDLAALRLVNARLKVAVPHAAALTIDSGRCRWVSAI
jgi:hypothetical protein